MTLPVALQVLVVDDEAPARARLRSLLSECSSPSARVVGEAADAAQALAWLQAHRCDLALLDIALPARNGLALAADMRSRLSSAPGGCPAIVFVTAHADHALQAFDVDAADYLTKPVRRERLQATLQRIAQRLRHGANWAPAPTLPTDDGGDALVVSERGRLVRVPVAEVLYLKAELKYITLRTATLSHVLDAALGDLEQRFGTAFLRIHRNALVARWAVRALERRPSTASDGHGINAVEAADHGDGWSLRLAGIDDWLPVSRRQLPAVRAALTDAAR